MLNGASRAIVARLSEVHVFAFGLILIGALGLHAGRQDDPIALHYHRHLGTRLVARLSGVANANDAVAGAANGDRLSAVAARGVDTLARGDGDTTGSLGDNLVVFLRLNVGLRFASFSISDLGEITSTKSKLFGSFTSRGVCIGVSKKLLTRQASTRLTGFGGPLLGVGSFGDNFGHVLGGIGFDGGFAGSVSGAAFGCHWASLLAYER